MHAEWTNSTAAVAEFLYVSADEDHRSYRTHHAPKAKRRLSRSKNKPSGIYRRRNHRWSW
jgi:hypothetical protein